MAQFATEKKAIGECDRCGITWPLKQLKFLTIRMKRTNIRVCPDCFEVDHPQFKLGTFKVFDPQALRNPRPANNVDRDLYPADAIGSISAVVGRAVVGISIVGRPLS